MNACATALVPVSSTSQSPAFTLSTQRRTIRQSILIGECQGVPKAALQSILGKTLGRRIWQQLRSQILPSTPIVTDDEVLHGMVEYISKQAAETLQEHGRKAKSIGLEIFYSDGVSGICRMRLARPTHDALELLAAALELFRRSQIHGATVTSIDLKVSSVEAELAPTTSSNLDYALTRALRVPV